MRSLLLGIALWGPSACGGDAPPITTYVEIELQQGVDDTQAWHIAADGFAGAQPWQRNGPHPSLGTCNSWRFVSEGPSVYVASRVLDIQGVGTFPMTEYPDGALDLGSANTLPPAPCVLDGAITAVQLGDQGSASTSMPPRPELLNPAQDATVDPSQGVELSWTPLGERDLTLVLSLFTDSFAFRGAVNCMVPDSGSFRIPALPQIPTDVAQARLQLRSEHHASAIKNGIELDLYVRQSSARHLLVAAP